MGLHFEVVDHNELFHSCEGEKLFANDFRINIAEDKEAFDRVAYSHYKDSEAIETTVSCDGGCSTETYKLGLNCTVCNTEIVRNSSRPIRPSMWIRTPKGVTSLISPQLWIMLSGYLAKKDFDFLEYLTNTSYRFDREQISSAETKKRVDRLFARDFPRGFNSFIENFDEIIGFLRQIGVINQRRGELEAFIAENRNKLFPDYIPIPSKLLFVVESTTSGIYMDKPIGAAIEAALTIAGIESSTNELAPIHVQNRVAKAMKLLGQFHENYGRDRIAKKPGLIRKHVLGGRINLTARAVITSISEPHDYNEIHIPWGVACQLLKYHIVNKLKRRFRMTAREAINYVYRNAVAYDKTLDSIFKELIRESLGGKGLACILARNYKGFVTSLIAGTTLENNVLTYYRNVMRAKGNDFRYSKNHCYW